MTQQDYESKKRECWEEYCKTHPLCNTSVMRLNFDWTFDRAYVLGKQEKDAEEISSLEEEIHIYAKAYSFTVEDYTAIRKAVEFGVSLAESDADAVIQGWVAIDEAYGQCFLHTEKPIQKSQPIADTGDYDTVWDSEGKTYLLDVGLFPDMDSESDPEPVEIIIKRNKK